METHEDGWFNKDGLNVGWGLDVPNTNVRFFVKDSKRHMTFGILESVLMGMMEMVQEYDKSNYPFVFQVNDRHWGEVGVGYVGLEPDGKVASCTYEISDGKPKPCSDVDARRVI